MTTDESMYTLYHARGAIDDIAVMKEGRRDTRSSFLDMFQPGARTNRYTSERDYRRGIAA